MKKIKIGIIALCIILNVDVIKAETISNIESYYSKEDYNKQILETMYNEYIEYFENQNTYTEYVIYTNSKTTNNSLMMFMGNNIQTNSEIIECNIGFNGNCFGEMFESEEQGKTIYKSIGNEIVETFAYISDMQNIFNYIYPENPQFSKFYWSLYDTNVNINNYDFNIYPFDEVEISGFYEDNIVLNSTIKTPKLKDLLNCSSWSEYENNYMEEYTEVNLENYEYVLLSLKNYDQTEAFSTNLQVKGQIGITPIYNFGQTSKDSITGVKIQDRCNVNYENYTSYPFYIIQNDLQNNVIYAVKECSSGSSFKFDNTIFNITYITQENEENPTITINGKTYNVIPYNDLPSTATKNEEENYIPGESGSPDDTGGLDSAIKGAQNKLSGIWDSITYFTSFIGQIFSSLPSEIHAILISAFTIMIMLGIIKIFLGK